MLALLLALLGMGILRAMANGMDGIFDGTNYLPPFAINYSKLSRDVRCVCTLCSFSMCNGYGRLLMVPITPIPIGGGWEWRSRPTYLIRLLNRHPQVLMFPYKMGSFHPLTVPPKYSMGLPKDLEERARGQFHGMPRLHDASRRGWIISLRGSQLQVQRIGLIAQP